MENVENLIICNPFERPTQHWEYDNETAELIIKDGRRSAGYFKANSNAQSVTDPGDFIPLEKVNKIREKVDEWREQNYPGMTPVTRKLLKYWTNEDCRNTRFFFCQLEAIETIIWFTEAPKSYQVGIVVEGDGGIFKRLCSKMATSTGKTVVMAMLIAWQTCNAASYPNDRRFSNNILVMSPGVTVNKRLSVLEPSDDANYYIKYQIVQDEDFDKIKQVNIIRKNWQNLMVLQDKKHDVVKKGIQSDYSFTNNNLGNVSGKLIIINDEAHHAWRKTDPNEEVDPDDDEMATKWIEALDRIARSNSTNDRIICCYDFSATPFKSTGKIVPETALFNWIISDFSLNDAIESGLTKTPRVAIRDDIGRRGFKNESDLYHIYENGLGVKDDLNTNKQPKKILPELVRNAYHLLEADWRKTKKNWQKSARKNKIDFIPPVMITICNNVNTAARVENHLTNDFEELGDTKYFLRIDSEILNKGNDVNDKKRTKKDEILKLREKVNTVGKPGKSGKDIWCIVAVQMLSEGWDAHNVTHIMGLRAFTSQLLCEQVVGRGLRRMEYEINPETNHFNPEYVNIFGIPFAYLPHVGGDGKSPDPPKPTILVRPVDGKKEHEISWPNIDRIKYNYVSELKMDWDKIKPLILSSKDEPIMTVSMAEVIDGSPVVNNLTDIDLEKIESEGNLRFQNIIFRATRDIFNEMENEWNTRDLSTLPQLVKIIEKFMEKDHIKFKDLTNDQMLRKKMTLLYNMPKIIKHILKYIKMSNTETKTLVFNEIPVKSTGMSQPWYTTKTVEPIKKSHINFGIYDSTWETVAAHEFEDNEQVISWVKNNHIGFGVRYLFDGIESIYWPDFIVRLKNNMMLILEIKGMKNERNSAKKTRLDEWVELVNGHGEFGTWISDIAYDKSEIKRIIKKHSSVRTIQKENVRCPSCDKRATGQKMINERFGYRNVDGIIRPQSWCKKCRVKINY